MITRIKKRLATVKKNSLRFRMVSSIWGQSKANRTKACLFYWVMVPTSAIAMFFFGILIFFYSIFGSLFGFLIGRPTQISSIKDQNKTPFHEYGYNLVTHKQNKFAIGNVFLVAGVGVLVYFFQTWGLFRFFTFPAFWAQVGFFFAGIAIILIIGGITSLVVQKKGEDIKQGWNKICPDLVVKDES